MTLEHKPFQNLENKPFQTQDKQPAKPARANELGAARPGISGEPKASDEKLTPAYMNEPAKDTMGAKTPAVTPAVETKSSDADKAIEAKESVVEKAVEVKDVVVEKASEAKDLAVEKMTEAKDAVVDTMQNLGEGAMRAGSATWRFTKANAVPLALVGVGAGWLIANRRRPTKIQPVLAYGAEPHADSWVEDTEAAPSTASARRRGRANGGSSARSGIASSSDKPKSSRIAGNARNMMAKAGEAMHSAEHKVADSASRSAAYISAKAQRAGTVTRDFAMENPVLVAMATLCAGVGIGMLLPSTERENKLFAPARAKFRDFVGDVREAASDVAQVAKDTASESMDAMR